MRGAKRRGNLTFVTRYEIATPHFPPKADPPMADIRLAMTIGYVKIIFMAYVATTIQILSGLALITLILLHSPKGEGLGGIGSGATLFTGPSQAEAGLDRVTWVAASVFIFSSALLGWGIIQF